MFTRIRAFLILSLVVLAGCSGGGGDGGGGSSTTSLRRTSGTGIRIIHAAVDAIPFDLVVNGKTVQTAHYAEATFFQGVSAGSAAIEVVGTAGSSSVIFNQTVTLARSTEYTILIYGSSRDGNLKARIIEEAVSRPDIGTTRIQIANGLTHGPDVQLVVAGKQVGPVNLGELSSPTDIPSGPQVVRVLTRRGGLIGEFTVDALERGELVVLATGDENLGVRFVPVFQDLD